MDIEAIRIECLKIRASGRPLLHASQIVEEARLLERYVTERDDKPEASLEEKPKPSKKVR